MQTKRSLRTESINQSTHIHTHQLRCLVDVASSKRSQTLSGESSNSAHYSFPATDEKETHTTEFGKKSKEHDNTIGSCPN
mmetsp:Transcript_13646/g.38412  ORF Transcript_13646/g.38412 Transcript_13646/m.38412 type:complete len:80 (-) Transcript_13646:1038-1277(-)